MGAREIKFWRPRSLPILLAASPLLAALPPKIYFARAYAIPPATQARSRANTAIICEHRKHLHCRLVIALGQVKKKKMFLVRISLKKRAGGRLFLLFIISYCMLSLHIITFPQGYVGALRSNINKTKHQILIEHKFV